MFIIELSFKKEMLLATDGLNSQLFYSDGLAVAQIIQNLIIIEPGTYPNKPDLGVGIKNYLFEFLTSEIKSSISSKIKTQINEFIPITNSYIDVSVISKDKIIGITIYIKKDSSDDTDTDSLSFSLLFGMESKENKLVSKILL